MPRLAPSYLRCAGSISSHLAALLPTCRTLPSTKSELRWIREHVDQQFSHQKTLSSRSSVHDNGDGGGGSGSGRSDEVERRLLTAHLVRRRAAGEPLQYVLGSQPFGALNVLCRRGVLIPRPETEAWVLRLAAEVGSSGWWKARCSETSGHDDGSGKDGAKREDADVDVRILDLCSGTGCIGLLLYEQLIRKGGRRRIRTLGLDIEDRAITLGRRNVRHNSRPGMPFYRVTQRVDGLTPNSQRDITFRKADIFTEEWMNEEQLFPYNHERAEQSTGGEGRERRCESGRSQIDILVSNPPYISARGFDRDTQRSVRNHEPRLALVPRPRDLVAYTSALKTAPAATTTVDKPMSSNTNLSTATTSDKNTNDDHEAIQVAAEDVFYARLLQIAHRLRPRIAVFEVGDMAQAVRVVRMALSHAAVADSSPPERRGVKRKEEKTPAATELSSVEIWRDWPDQRPEPSEDCFVRVDDRHVSIRGSGHGRAVVLRWV